MRELARRDREDLEEIPLLLPALFTRRSMRLNRASAVSTTTRFMPRSARSTATISILVSAVSSALVIDFASASSRSRRRATSTRS
jgi:hypothetical protein